MHSHEFYRNSYKHPKISIPRSATICVSALANQNQKTDFIPSYIFTSSKTCVKYDRTKHTELVISSQINPFETVTQNDKKIATSLYKIFSSQDSPILSYYPTLSISSDKRFGPECKLNSDNCEYLYTVYIPFYFVEFELENINGDWAKGKCVV